VKWLQPGSYLNNSACRLTTAMQESDCAEIVMSENTIGCGGGPYLNVTSDNLIAAPDNLSTTGNL